MGGGGNSGKTALSRARLADRPKRQSSSGIKFARELFEKNDGTFLRSLKTRLLVDMDNFSKTGKVSANTVSYRIIYQNGAEVIVRYKDGKEIIKDPKDTSKRYKSFRLNKIAYISRADGNQNFSDSLGFSSSTDKRMKSIFSSDSRFKSYNNEVSKLFKPKRKKSTSKKSSTKKSTGTTINKSATKPKVWEKGKKTVVSKKKK